MLTNERLDDGECLTTARGSYHPCTTERVHDVHPSLAKLTLIVVAHRDIHAVLIIFLLLALLETLVLKIKTVFH